MVTLGFYKAQPTEYVIKYVRGKVVEEGIGLSFYYLEPSTQIVAIPINTADVPFVFNEVTRDFQTVALQGQCTYRIADPQKAASLLNFIKDTRTHKYATEDRERLAQQVTTVVQMQARVEINQMSLDAALGGAENLAHRLRSQAQDDAALLALGVEVLSVYIVALKPTPEVAKALEANYRETLLRRADEAIYARRAAAVEEERKIKENELNTDITLEQQRQQLIELQGDNEQREAEFHGKATELSAQYTARAAEMELAVYHTFEPRAILALAMKELGHNAERVGNLTITSEVMAALLNLDGVSAPAANGSVNGR